LTKRKSKRSAKGRNAEPKAAVSLATTQWDQGATGAANRQGLAVEKLPEPNPNGVRRARRVDMLEVWFRKGELSAAQFNTAVLLRNAFEETMQAPGTDYARPRVDSSPKPDHAIYIQIDRVSKLREVSRNVSAEDAPLLNWCAVGGHSPCSFRVKDRKPYLGGTGYVAGMQALRDALDRAGRN
jgi:hypothetical protein